MQFSDSSTDMGLIQDVTFWTGTDLNEYSLNERTRNINIWYHKVVTMILQSQDEWDFDDPAHADFPILTTPLVADQRDYTIPISEKVLKIKRVDICYDGTGNTCFKAEPFDVNETGLGLGNDTDTDARIPQQTPLYDMIGSSIRIFPRADAGNVTNGGIIRTHWIREIDEFTTADTIQEPGFDEPFHRMLSLGASLDWALRVGLQNKNDLAALLQDYEARLKQYYGSRQTDRNYTLKPSFIDYR